MRNIVILGGAGYIGRSLIELYARAGDVLLHVVDIVFVPAVAKRLTEIGGAYYVGDIGDAGLMRRLLVDQTCGVCYLLAGQIEAETSGERERAMWVENYEKPCAVMELCRPATRLFFPSSANVFGGNHDHTDTVYSEGCGPQPMYPYAETKSAMEVAIAEWGGNATVARLGTNYGWGVGVRFNLVVNKFVQMARQGKQLSVHGSGNNYRPFCNNHDCAEAAKFLAEHPHGNTGIWHVVEDNYTVNDIADVVRANVCDTGVKHIAFRKDFASYQMSSERLLGLGFSFTSDLQRGVVELSDRLSSLR